MANITMKIYETMLFYREKEYQDSFRKY